MYFFKLRQIIGRQSIFNVSNFNEIKMNSLEYIGNGRLYFDIDDILASEEVRF